MNVFTLKFKVDSMEQLYQASLQSAVPRKIMTIILISSVIVAIVDLVGNLPFDGQSDKIFSLTFIFYASLATVLLFFKNNTIGIIMFISNLLFSLEELNIAKEYNSYNGYLLGSNQMFVHATILYISSYPSAILQNIFLCVIRLLITFYNTDYNSIEQYLYTVGASLVYTFILYCIEKNKRNFFIINLRDHSKDEIFPVICSKPYFIFCQHKINQVFEEISNNISQQNFNQPFSQFLETCQIEKLSLKSYLYQLIEILNEKQQNHKSINLIVKNKRKPMDITFHSFVLEQKYFVITINNLDAYAQKSKFCFDKYTQSLKIKFMKILKQINSTQKTIISSQDFVLAIKLKISIDQLLLHQKYNLKTQIKVEILNLYTFINQFVKYFQQFKYQISLLPNFNQEILIKSQKDLIYIYFYEQFKDIKRNSQIQLQLIKKGEVIQLEVIGINKISQSTLMKNYQNILFEKVEKLKKGYLFTFPEEPMISFMSQNY